MSFLPFQKIVRFVYLFSPPAAGWDVCSIAQWARSSGEVA